MQVVKILLVQIMTSLLASSKDVPASDFEVAEPVRGGGHGRLGLYRAAEAAQERALWLLRRFCHVSSCRAQQIF